MYREIRALNWPIHFQMHLSDFVDYNNDEMRNQMPMEGRGVYIPQALSIPIKKKWLLFEKMIEMIVKDYQFFTLQQLAESLNDKRQT
jgi:hypothetical protein